MPEQHHSRRRERGLVGLQKPARAVTREDCEIHVGRLAGWGAFPVEEISVPIDEPQAARRASSIRASASPPSCPPSREQAGVTERRRGTLLATCHPGTVRRRVQDYQAIHWLYFYW
jgi:hypothetical protein